MCVCVCVCARVRACVIIHVDQPLYYCQCMMITLELNWTYHTLPPSPTPDSRQTVPPAPMTCTWEHRSTSTRSCSAPSSSSTASLESSSSIHLVSHSASVIARLLAMSLPGQPVRYHSWERLHYHHQPLMLVLPYIRSQAYPCNPHFHLHE